MNTNTDEPVGYRLTIEAVGDSQSDAVKHALSLLGCMIQDGHLKGHSCGGESGNASGKWDVVFINSRDTLSDTPED